jgi:hypothetical protein
MKDRHDGAFVRMHNPPDPGLVLREYLGDLALTTVAALCVLQRTA